MSLSQDLRAGKIRFSAYIDQLSNLLREYHVSGENWYANLKSAAANPDFVARRNAIWSDILGNEGGKLTFGTVLGIVGAVLGGAGIAMAGGAFGLPLVLLLVPLGVWIGNEADEEGLTRRFLAKLGSWRRNEQLGK